MKKQLVLSFAIGLLFGLPSCGGCCKTKTKKEAKKEVVEESGVEETPEKVAKF